MIVEDNSNSGLLCRVARWFQLYEHHCIS